MDNLELLSEESGYITERLTDDKSIRPGCLGKLKGPIAEWKDPTRNDRYYSKKLWERVFNTPWVKEALETHTLFGEADHPENRIEPKLTEAAVVLTDYSINEVDQTVYGTFDILDTPHGRILRTLSDYGCKLGVSSRGRGRLVKRNGKTMVEESTYVFGGFDVVALPAVKKARQTFMAESVEESDKNLNLINSITSQINECNSVNDLNVIKNILVNAKLDESGKFDEAITARIDELESKDNTIIEGLTNDLKEAYKKNEKLESELKSAKTNTISLEESVDSVELMNHLVEQNNSYVSVISALKSESLSKDSKIMVLESKISNLTDKLKSLSEVKSKQSTEDLANLNKKLSESIESSQRVELELTETRSSLNDSLEEVETLKESLSESEELNSKLKNDNEELTTQLKESYDDYNELVKEFNGLLEENQVMINKYLEEKSAKLSLSPDAFRRLLPENYTLEDIDEALNSQLAIKKKLSKLPIAESSMIDQGVHPRVRRINESVPSELEGTARLLKQMKGQR